MHQSIRPIESDTSHVPCGGVLLCVWLGVCAQVVSEQRCRFKFSALTIRTPARRLRLPPVGQGWFDTVYLDSSLRIARDVRGDTLVTTRSPLPLDNWRD